MISSNLPTPGTEETLSRESAIFRGQGHPAVPGRHPFRKVCRVVDDNRPEATFRRATFLEGDRNGVSRERAVGHPLAGADYTGPSSE